MKAIQLSEYGNEQSLKEVQVADPAAGEGQVVVDIHAASINPLDLKLASGAMRQMMPLTFPWVPGIDFSGVVKAAGPGVTSFGEGDEVFGCWMSGGAYAERIAIGQEQLELKPRSVGHVEAASLSLVAQTAMQAIESAGLKSGQTILILGAGGAVGSVAVQIAHRLGAHIIASAASDSADRLRSFGADEVLDYKTTPFENVAHEVDAVLDGVGGDAQQKAFAALKRGGLLVALTQPPSPEQADKYGVRALMLQTDSSAASLKTLAKRIDAGEIKPTVAKTYFLSEAAQAWKDLQTMHPQGKLVLATGK